MKKSLISTKGNKSKFWEIELEELVLTTRFGKIGSEGKTAAKSFANFEKGYKQYVKKIEEKLLSDEYYDVRDSADTFPLEETVYNSSAFLHKHRVLGGAYSLLNKTVCSSCEEYLYLFDEKGKELDTLKWEEDEAILKSIDLYEIPEKKEILVHIVKLDKSNPDQHLVKDFLHIFDVSKNKLNQKLNKEIELPTDTYFYYRAIEATSNEILLAFPKGFVKLNHQLEILNSFLLADSEFDAKFDIDTIGVSANIEQGLIAVATWEQEKYNADAGKGNVIIVNEEGEIKQKITTKFKGETARRGGWDRNKYTLQMCFNKLGSKLYTVGQTDTYGHKEILEVWNVETGEKIKEHEFESELKSISLSRDEEYLLISLDGSVGGGVLRFSLETEEVVWRNFKSFAQICYYSDQEYLFSSGNIFLKGNLSTGKTSSRVAGHSESCDGIYYDQKKSNLWIAGDYQTCCLDKKGEALNILENTFGFFVGKAGEVLLKTGLDDERTYSWIKNNKAEEIPNVSAIYNDRIVVSKNFLVLGKYHPSREKEIKFTNHKGELIKELELSDYQFVGLEVTTDERTLIAAKEHKIEVWDLVENKLSYLINNKHTNAGDKCKVHISKPFFVTTSNRKVNLWKLNETEPLLFDFCSTSILLIESFKNLEEFVIIDESLNVYTINVEQAELKQLGKVDGVKNPEGAYLSENGTLFINTEKKILSADLKSILNL